MNELRCKSETFTASSVFEFKNILKENNLQNKDCICDCFKHQYIEYCRGFKKD